ncbi:MAG: homoserine kinase [Peptococcaceae bacterium]|nr:homoserine kinase [Peptococcaceae bacterium]
MNKEEWFGDAPQLVIKTPATSANMGPGFDCLGMAVNLHNELWIKALPEGATSTISVEGYGEGQSESLDNLIYTTYLDAFAKLGKKAPAIALHCINRIPFARGLGSSSAAAVSGLAAAQIMSGMAFSEEALMQMATASDGHPDNVLPALLGGIVIACMTEDGLVHASKIAPLKNMHAYALIPDYPLATADARAAMPESYSRQDVVYNLSRLGLMIAMLSKGDLQGLSEVFSDRVHEPYRLPLMPGIEEAKKVALAEGAFAAVVSGAGSTMLILSETPKDFSKTKAPLEALGYGAELMEVAPIMTGVECYKDEMELKLWP